MSGSRRIASMIILLVAIYQSRSTISITQPIQTPFDKNQIQYWYTNFGVIHYNKPLSYELYVSNSDLCGDQEEAKINHFTKPTYIVVGQYGCSYPKKALKAQSLGAQGILIASNDIDYAEGDVVLGDDGYGRKVKIAVLVIKPDDKNLLAGLNNPRIKINFPIKTKVKSSVTLFLSAGDRKSFIFLRDFKNYFDKIKDSINLSVVYHTFECNFCDDSECVLQKKCCAFDSEYFHPGKGKYIVQEQFREQQLFEELSKNQSLQKWFDYMDLFDLQCDNDWINSAACSKNVLQILGITHKLKLIDQFETMMEWRRIETKTGIFSYPEVSVNGIRHQETLTAASSFSMICESLQNPPQGCVNSRESAPKKGNKVGVIVGVVLALVVALVGGFLCYKKLINREITNDMSSRVNELVAKYASKVSEQKKKRKDKLMERMTEQL